MNNFESFVNENDMRPMTIVIGDKTYNGYFTDMRVYDTPANVFKYDFRSPDDEDDEIATIERKVIVNWFGSFFTTNQIELGEKGYLEVDEWGFDEE